MEHLVEIKKSDIESFECPHRKRLDEIYKYFIFNQGHNLSCSVSAAISLIEYLRQKEGKECEKFSVGFLYHEALQLERNESTPGLKASSVLKSLIKKGVCLQEKWSSLQNVNVVSSEKAVIDALSRIKYCNIEAIDPNIDTIRYIIGFCERPIVAVMNIYDTENFYCMERSYEIVHSPKFSLFQKNSDKHSILLVGYDDTVKVIYFQNSYGEEWGLNGFGRISYDYISCFDLLYSMDESCIKGYESEEEKEIEEIEEVIE